MAVDFQVYATFLLNEVKQHPLKFSSNIAPQSHDWDWKTIRLPD